MTLPISAAYGDSDSDQSEGGLFDFFARLNVSICTLSDEIKKQSQLEQMRLANLPNYILQSKFSQPAGVTDIQDFGGPQPGRYWNIKLLSAMASPIAANATVVTWYIGQNIPGPAAGQLPSTMAIWQFPSVPSFTNAGDVWRVLPGQHLIAGLTGIPGGSAIALNVAFYDQPIWAQRDVFAIE